MVIMNKQRIYKIALLVAILAAFVLSLITFLEVRRMESRFTLRDETILKLDESKAHKDTLMWNYLNKWMEEGYISGYNRHELEKMK